MLAPSLAMRGTLQGTLGQPLVKLQSVWRDAQRAYAHWQKADLPTPPSQHIAFQQLRFRFDNQIPIAVCLVAPAGFGKSETLAAWRAYTALQGSSWDAVAPTGVAASQVGGEMVPCP